MRLRSNWLVPPPCRMIKSKLWAEPNQRPHAKGEAAICGLPIIQV